MEGRGTASFQHDVGGWDRSSAQMTGGWHWLAGPVNPLSRSRSLAASGRAVTAASCKALELRGFFRASKSKLRLDYHQARSRMTRPAMQPDQNESDWHDPELPSKINVNRQRSGDSQNLFITIARLFAWPSFAPSVKVGKTRALV